MYSATKHIDGQGRVLGGAILGSQKFCDKIIKPFIRNTGPSISPFNAWILLKSLETLELRVNQQVKNAEVIVDFLNNHNKVAKVIYPLSKKFKQNSLAKKQMLSGGTVISFELKFNKQKNIKKETFKFINKLEMIDISNNLGDTKTLITHPSTTTHHRLSNSEKKNLGIKDNLLRLSVGLEDIDDIINDIKMGLI
jgi:O-succinylhomoserine sulfhydrylase